MIKKIIPLLLLVSVCLLKVNAQYITPERYIEMYKDIAMSEMRRMGVPAAITLAQGLIETENGNSVLLKKSNNHFGIKCKSNWTAESVTHDDDAPGECFRSYKDADDSYRDHSKFLRGNDRYAFLFLLDPSDYKAWANGLRKAGYATNPKYPQILIKNIEQYNLQQYSWIALNETPKCHTKTLDAEQVAFDPNQKVEGDYKKDETAKTSAEVALDPIVESVVFGKVTTVNNIKCITAQKGTSLLAIASQHHINLRKLLDYNDMEEDGILEEDQVIFLQKKAGKGDKPFYLVSKTETFYDVAQKNGVQFQAVLDFNQVSEDKDLQPGTKVYLQPLAVRDETNVAKLTASKSKTYYKVQPKDGLYAVARKYSVTVHQLREWNNLASDELKIGQQLIVSE